ncbi:MAG: MBL fold metallo-hydrolase [Euryarchaeota archaeon]|nr:MBL fold metallo-hydrolase [Euryarchaeota archaeon]
MNSTNIGNVTIEWLGHAGFVLRGQGHVVYIDPYVIPDVIKYEDQADLLLITHEHSDHCYPESIRKIRKSDATTLIPESCSLQFRGDARRIKEGDMLNGDLAIKGMEIEIVAAYNKGKPFHPRGIGVGYIIGIAGKKIYHAGDTDLIPEMDNISVDVALLPIGGTSTMDVAEAAEAAARIHPKVAIPMHYNCVDGTGADPEVFKELVRDKAPDVDVIILQA